MAWFLKEGTELVRRQEEAVCGRWKKVCFQETVRRPRLKQGLRAEELWKGGGVNSGPCYGRRRTRKGSSLGVVGNRGPAETDE